MNDVDIKLLGAEELLAAFRDLDYATQHKRLKQVIRDAANKTVVKDLKRVTPVVTGTLKSSMGTVDGKSRRTATIFAGPRMGGKHKGYVANILDNAKDGRRYPKKAKALKIGDQYYKSVGPIRKKTNFKQTIIQSIPFAEKHMVTSLRTIIERAWKRRAKR